jgi:hypothetical protein
MKIAFLSFLTICLLYRETPENKWIKEAHSLYDLSYKSKDSIDIKRYNQLFEIGILKVRDFFNAPFTKKFTIVIHPNRLSLDSTWQTDWKLPTFKSECWMVASGTAFRLDLLSPKDWKTEACEHISTDVVKTQQIITHELVHVFHGQINASPNFDNIDRLDWFIEGLATYASGQCDSLILNEVKRALIENSAPNNLDNFWNGNLKYGFSGSLVMFIDKKIGREKLKQLLKLQSKTELLYELKITEKTLMIEWEDYIKNL